MKTDKLIYTAQDGRTKIVTIPPEFFERHMAEGWSEKDCFDYVKFKESQREGVDVKAMDKVPQSAIPSDRTFRNAWEKKQKAISVNMTKAKAIAQDKIRERREPVLQKLDIEYMKAVESGNDTKTITDKKQQLRDAPADKRLDVTTPEKLKSAMETIITDIERIGS